MPQQRDSRIALVRIGYCNVCSDLQYPSAANPSIDPGVLDAVDWSRRRSCNKSAASDAILRPVDHRQCDGSNRSSVDGETGELGGGRFSCRVVLLRSGRGFSQHA
jgi:hypothetical protein